jgi:hypothetical protein
MKKYLVPAFGAAAFVVGGLIARQKAFEAIETLSTIFSKKSDLPA